MCVFCVGYSLSLHHNDYIIVYCSRFVLFEVEHRCHLTFDADPLTLPVPFTPYNIYYSPNTSQAASKYTPIIKSIHTCCCSKLLPYIVYIPLSQVASM